MSKAEQSRSSIGENDHALLDAYDIPDFLLHARKLQGLVTYTLDEVKGAHSAMVIYALVRKYNRLLDSKSARSLAELREKNEKLKGDVVRQRKELRRLWIIESEYSALRTARTELPSRLEAPA